MPSPNIADLISLKNLIPKQFDARPTSLSQADYLRANQLLTSGDRAGMYLFLAEKTGNPAYVNTAQISSGSGCTVGGPAIAVNAALQLRYPDIYPNISITQFSDEVARKEIGAFERTVNPATGAVTYIGPSELNSYIVGRNAWATVVEGRPEVGDLFPGNLLLAAHYIKTGEFTKFYEYVNDKTLAVALDLGASVKNEISNAGTQYGKTLSQSWSLIESNGGNGGKLTYEFAPGQNAPLMVFRDASGSVYSVFTRTDRLVCGLEQNSPGVGIPVSPLRRKVVFNDGDGQQLTTNGLAQKIADLGGDPDAITEANVTLLRGALSLYSGQVDAYLDDSGRLVLAANYRQTSVELDANKWTSTFIKGEDDFVVQNSSGGNFRVKPPTLTDTEIVLAPTNDFVIGPLKSSIETSLSNGQINTYVNTTLDVLNFGASVLNGKLPAAYNFATGITLINKNLNPFNTTDGYKFPVLNSAAVVAQGAQSLYNLGQTFASGGNTLGKAYALGNTLNYVNTTLINNVTLNTALNGTGAVFNGARDGLVSGGSFNGIANGGTPGVLPVVGLLLAIKSGDPVGIVQGAIGLFNPALLAGPVGWILAGISILKVLFPKAPPKAWGTANVTYGEGVLNTALLVNAQGESFGTARAKQTLEGMVANLQSYINATNAATNAQPSTTLTADQKADQQLGIIAQRLPSLSWRASDLNDKGYSLTEIDPLTGQQKLPYRRFDDDGVPFSSNPNAYTVDLSDPAQRQNLNYALLTAAQERGALAPMWEVNTAKMQANAGAVNAGLSEEERAAKAGYAAPVDAAYVAAHQADYAGKPVSTHKRVGSFMAVGLDLDGNGGVSTTTVAQNATRAPGGQAINFNWDNTNYQKKVGWVSANDAMLVLDKDFNQSVDNGTELLSNPLVADAAKGLRSLATWDANADGVINSLDPVYRQLKVWQDFNQDGDNTSYKTIGGRQQAVQDERVGNHSQICSKLSPYDADILQIKLENCKIEDGTGRIPEKPRACQRRGRRYKQGFQGKKWQCQRHMVIVCYEKISPVATKIEIYRPRTAR